MKKITFAVLGAVVFLTSGCSFNNPFASDDATSAKQDIVIQKVDKEDIRSVMKQEKMIYDIEPADAVFGAVGEGIAPTNTVSHAQSLNSKDTVRDAMLRDSTITAQVAGLIKNASIVEHDFKDGLYRVRMEMKIDQSKWQEIFAY